MNWIRSTMHLPNDCTDIDWSTTENEPTEDHNVRADRKPKQTARPLKKQGMRPAQRRARYGGNR